MRSDCPAASTLALMNPFLRCLSAVLWAGMLCMAGAAHALTMSEMSGMWLLAAEPHDSSIERGVVAAEYPVLVITGQGAVRAYRYGLDCGSDVTKNPLLPETEKLGPCIRKLANLNADQLAGVAVPVTEGQVHGKDSGWQFQPNDRHRLTDAIKSADSLGPKAGGVPYQYLVFTRLFGDVLQVSVRGQHMELAAPSGHFSYRFVRVDPTRMAGVGSLLNVVGLSYGQYFRCAMENIKDGDLLKEAWRIQELVIQGRALYFRLLEGGSRQQLPDLQRLSETASARTAELVKMPVLRAALPGKFGAHIGCPDRDRQAAAARDGQPPVRPDGLAKPAASP